MFNGQQFYHEHIRKAIISFGTIFNNIQISRKLPTGEVAQTLTVPLSYAPKQKMIARIQDFLDPEDGRSMQVTLPRMAFEITSLNYDSSRALNKLNRVRAINSTANNINESWVSTPYNMGINLSIFTRNQEDGLQILEQILPYFNPDFNITVNEIPTLGVKRDIQFVLDNVNYTDEYSGNFTDRISVVWDLTFIVKMNFFGFVQRAEQIKKSISNIYAVKSTDDDTINNFQGLRETVSATVTDPNATPDNYTFVEEFDTAWVE